MTIHQKDMVVTLMALQADLGQQELTELGLQEHQADLCLQGLALQLGHLG